MCRNRRYKIACGCFECKTPSEKIKSTKPYEFISILKIDGKEVEKVKDIYSVNFEPREEGDLEKISFYLDDMYEWKIVTDSEGIQVALPYSIKK